MIRHYEWLKNGCGMFILKNSDLFHPDSIKNGDSI